MLFLTSANEISVGKFLIYLEIGEVFSKMCNKMFENLLNNTKVVSKNIILSSAKT